MLRKVMCVFGTRPEAIKMAPVVKAIASCPDLDVSICVTAQQREMLDQVLELFELKPDYDLNLMTRNQTLNDVTAKVVSGLQPVLAAAEPDLVLVHGDTTTTMAGALASFYNKIAVGHVEAGLRTHDIYSPWPEEVNRQITSRIAGLNFAPTALARDNLLKESICEDSIHVTGNTVIDALLRVVDKIKGDQAISAAMDEKFHFLNPNKRLVLVTGHRRENFGQGVLNICEAIAELARDPEVEVVYPVHLNPNVRKPVFDLLSDFPNVHLIEPLEYLPFVHLMDKSYIILTDSGGIQEEAPSLGKPVLVMRNTTERPEAIDKGTVLLVGTDKQAIVREARNLLDSDADYKRMSMAHNPYGDGKASARIVDAILEHDFE